MSTAISEWLVAQWTLRFREILQTMGELQPKTQVERLPGLDERSGLLWWQQPFSCDPEAPVWLGAAPEAWSGIGKLVLDAAGLENAPESEIQSTFLEIVRQSMSSLAGDIGQRTGSQVSCENGIESAPTNSGQIAFRIDIELPAQNLELILAFGEGLSQKLAGGEMRAIEAAETHASGPLPRDGSMGSRTLELLLDVEMPISVSFGCATIKLQDALKLITGSMIELDRGLDDPVELLVNNCVIARGEVVVVEGNYGVRITEIVTQKERLQQSRRFMLQ